MEISEITSQLVKWSMDLAQAQVQTAGRNIASANVPDYLPQRVDFSRQLAAVRASLNDPATLAATLRDVSAQDFRLVSATGQSLLGNGVQLDHEVAQMLAANTRYVTLVESLNRHFGLMRLAVTSRG